MGKGRHRLARGTPLVRPAWEGSAEDRWQLEGGGAIQVEGRSVTRLEVGGEEGEKRERSGVYG